MAWKTDSKDWLLHIPTRRGLNSGTAESRPEPIVSLTGLRLPLMISNSAAKERQGMLEAKIAELKNLVATARIIDQSKLQTEEVQLLNKVTIKNLKNNAKMTYTIVSETEANLRAGKISITTPIAKGLIGHKVGDVVEVQAPVGKMQFEIIEIGI